MMTICAWLVLAASSLTAQAPAPAPAAPAAHADHAAARYHGVLIRVPDLEQALAFYRGTLGFAATRLSPTLARLDDDTPVYLEQVGYALRPPADDEARASVAFQTHDIRAAIARLRAAGVAFLADEPQAVGVGLAIRFRDPFGNIHALLEQTVAPSPPFEEPQVYNSGFKHPDGDTAALRALLVDTLGFVVRTERYYPPSIPIGHADGSFAFMLHENEPWEAEVRPRPDPEAAPVSLIFVPGTGGIGPAPDRPALRIDAEQGFVLGHRSRMIFPSGIPVELWRLDATQ